MTLFEVGVPNPYHLGEGHRYRCSESATGQFQSSDKRFSTPKMIVAKDVTTLRELCTIFAKRGAAMMFRVLFAASDPTDSWKGHRQVGFDAGYRV